VRVLEPGTERPVPRGEQGELCCRGPYTLRGYFNAAEHNAEAFTTDGFYRTGDIVVQLEDFSGAPIYALEDRIKDMISRGGEKINAAEMDELLRSHPAIEESAVVAMPHPVMGEKACAFIVLAEGATAPDLPELQSFLDGRSVAKYKWPERIEVRDELPKTNIYKINKLALRREIAGLIADEIGATA
jgi:non-ribosomal peptide synthetase component E (peptide arylation enzyme)